MTAIRFNVVGTEQQIDADVRRVLVAGFTGRDSAAVESHLAELRDLGVPVPERVPIVMPLPGHSVVAAGVLQVNGSFTSGEVEPVIVYHGGRRWLALGSDHTDRDIERESIEASKAACPKVIGSDLIDLATVDDPEALQLASWVDRQETPYQSGSLAEIMALADIEQSVKALLGEAPGDGDVLFMGTLPVVGRLRPAERFTASLHDPLSGRRLALEYTISVQPAIHPETGAVDAQA